MGPTMYKMLRYGLNLELWESFQYVEEAVIPIPILSNMAHITIPLQWKISSPVFWLQEMQLFSHPHLGTKWVYTQLQAKGPDCGGRRPSATRNIVCEVDKKDEYLVIRVLLLENNYYPLASGTCRQFRTWFGAFPSLPQVPEGRQPPRPVRLIGSKPGTKDLLRSQNAAICIARCTSRYIGLIELDTAD